MTRAFRPGDVLATRYRLVDLLVETGNGRFWRAYDSVLERHVALHTIAADDERSHTLLAAARRSTTVVDRHVLRVLDAAVEDGVCYVVNEWGSGVSLDILVGGGAVLTPRQAAWVVAEVADSVALAHEKGVAHGRLAPENLLIDRHGQVRVIGLCVDAALHGQPFDRPATDVTDLAGLLYCALTATWAGTSRSDVRRAPREHGRVLRPRRVRAGVPRPLDGLCDLVLHPHADPRGRLEDVSAAGIARTLHEFVGDPAGLPEELAASLPPVRERFPLTLPAVPEVRPRDAAATDPVPLDETPTETATAVVPNAGPNAGPGAGPGDTPDTAPTIVPGRPGAADVPTQAAFPSLEAQEPDDGESPTRQAPPPPPPLEDPPERPLFAPDPPDGGPARRPRRPAAETTSSNGARADGQGTPGADEGAGAGFWPWETGSREIAAVPPPAPGLVTPVDDSVPGRNAMRVALAIALLLALLVGAVVIYNLGRGRTPLGAEPDPTPSTPGSTDSTASATPEPIEGLTATDLDPQGDDGAENSDEAPLAVDGDPATGWRTVLYFDQFGPTGLKTGVGLTIDLGDAVTVAEVDLTFGGTPTSATVYVADEPPTDVTGLSEVATTTDAGEQVTLTLEEPTEARYLVVWLTSLPGGGAEYRGEVREVAVRGG